MADTERTTSQIIDLQQDTTPSEGDLFLAQGADGSKAIDYKNIEYSILEKLHQKKYPLQMGNVALPQGMNILNERQNDLENAAQSSQNYLEEQARVLREYVLSHQISDGDGTYEAVMEMLSNIDGGTYDDWKDPEDNTEPGDEPTEPIESGESGRTEGTEDNTEGGEG